jgi:hypothetical protein
MPNDRDPEKITQAEIGHQAVEEPDDPHTRREEVELDRMEATTD